MAKDHLLGLTLVKSICWCLQWVCPRMDPSTVEHNGKGAHWASLLDGGPFVIHRHCELGSHYLQLCNHWWPHKAPHIALNQFWYNKINHLKKICPLFFHPSPPWPLLFPLNYGMVWPLFVAVVWDRVSLFGPDCARTPSGQGRMEG